MLEKLHLKNVGPAPELEMEFAPRLNIITGDNGLGKSFILDVAWGVLALGSKTVDSNSPQFLLPIPSQNAEVATGEFTLKNSDGESQKIYGNFNFANQDWDLNFSHEDESLVLYMKVDGSFSIRQPASDSVIYIDSKEIWNGLQVNVPLWGGSNRLKIVSNGLIRDWASWQLEKGATFKQLIAALGVLSPKTGDQLKPGELTRVSLDDVRDIPTLKTSYGQEVPIIHASAGIKRIVALAYTLVWAWQELLKASKITRREPTRKILVLIDEIEQHLHPSWQRVILESVLDVVKEIMQNDVEIQIIATTHSPLVMASLEPLFDPKKDAWFDFNLVKGKVTLEKMPWHKRGGAEEWLTSEAFDLDSTGSLENARVKNLAAKALNNPKLSKKKFLELDSELRNVLPEMDEFWIRWRFIGEKKGYL
jgi:hypothetical protein